MKVREKNIILEEVQKALNEKLDIYRREIQEQYPVHLPRLDLWTGR